MAITGVDAERIVTYALAGTPEGRASADNAIAIANDAGRWLMNARSWRWAAGARATLGLTASQSYITLPADFQEFIGEPYKTDGLTGGFEWTSLPMLVELAVDAPTVASDYFFGALTWDQSGNGAPVARIELHPTPNATEASALTCFYRRGWYALPAPADTTPAKLPDWMEGLYVGALEAFARGWEDGISHPAIRQQYLAGLMAGPEWASAVRRDALGQPNFGVIKNGVLSSRGRFWSRVSGLSAPS
jgi:hypothetical protein